MSDEYSVHGRFLMGKDSAAEYERRLARLRRLEDEREEGLRACERYRESRQDRQIDVEPDALQATDAEREE